MTLNFAFTQRRYTLQYYSISDVLSKIGGIRSIIAPVFSFIVPLLMLYFLINLVDIIHEYIQK